MLENYWALEPSEVARELSSSLQGLSAAEAEERLKTFGLNEIREDDRLSRWKVLWSQVRSPLQLLLVFAALASALTGEWTDAIIVLLIVIASSGIGYIREYNANLAASALKARIRLRARVLRDGTVIEIPLNEIVPGDVLILSAGSLVPADAVLIESSDCYVNEATLTGESFPVEKRPGLVLASTRLAERTNCVFAGSNVRSGTARCIVVKTGRATPFGTIAHRLSMRPPETEFDRGIRRFGYLLTIAMLIITLVVFAVHVVRGRPAIDTLLFAIALAVGLSPELLPAILNVNLARSAQAMARRGVLVRRLNAIENLGSMDVLCTDKTGTITEGVVKLQGSYDPAGDDSARVLELAAINAATETGLENPLDDAILQARRPNLEELEKLAEIPFDFMRKRVSVVVKTNTGAQLITKGAFNHVLEICTIDPEGRSGLEQRYQSWSKLGLRVIAIAQRDIEIRSAYSRADEVALVFCGFLTFLDRPKEGLSLIHISEPTRLLSISY